MNLKLRIGKHVLSSALVLAPMAGVTDRPFRTLCRKLGAGMAVSEMLTADSSLWDSPKSRFRLDHDGEPNPRCVQIAGADPKQLAEAARLNAERGAQIIDINMGCPAKKVCSKACGSALLKDEYLVAELLKAVVNAVDIPVTLKIRTGWDSQHRNALNVARIAEDLGVQALSVHGRTRADKFNGAAEFETIAAIKSTLSIPVIANGDIDDADKALKVLAQTQADGLMIGRAAQGNPWIFAEINARLNGEGHLAPSRQEQQQTLIQHVNELHEFYGAERGLRIARKHISWYLKTQPASTDWRNKIVRIDDPDTQLSAINDYFSHSTTKQDLAA